MDLANKLKDLRHHAGHVRGLGRALTQAEVADGIHAKTGSNISQGYISQLERGRRVHLTSQSRAALAHFFGVHPGYLVSDPEAGHAVSVSNGLFHQQQHPAAHRTLARLAVHPRGHHLWPLLDHVLDLTEDDFHVLRAWIEERAALASVPATAE